MTQRHSPILERRHLKAAFLALKFRRDQTFEKPSRPERSFVKIRDWPSRLAEKT